MKPVRLVVESQATFYLLEEITIFSAWDQCEPGVALISTLLFKMKVSRAVPSLGITAALL